MDARCEGFTCCLNSRLQSRRGGYSYLINVFFIVLVVELSSYHRGFCYLEKQRLIMTGISKRERSCRWEDYQKPVLVVSPARELCRNKEWFSGKGFDFFKTFSSKPFSAFIQCEVHSHIYPACSCFKHGMGKQAKPIQTSHDQAMARVYCHIIRHSNKTITCEEMVVFDGFGNHRKQRSYA